MARGATTPAKHRVNPWIIAAVVSLAAFMEVLDTSIANVALPYMAGGLASSLDDASWVLTSYLVANAVVLPISGWLSLLFGRKRFYMACVVIFTISSFSCVRQVQQKDFRYVGSSKSRGRGAEP